MSDRKTGSWFSDWAAKLGVPTWAIWVAAVVVGVILARVIGLI